MRCQYAAISAIFSVCTSGEAIAQRTEQNATAQSTDAFGQSVGNERNGLYSHLQVRGFNPIDAGNVRLNGLYADLIDRAPQRLSEESVVRVGITTLRYAFPAPTGLVDYTLNRPADSPQASVEISNGTSLGSGIGGNFQFDLPLFGNRVGLNAGVGFRQAERPEGGTHSIGSYGAILAFRPTTYSEILLFSGGNLVREQEARVTLFPVGNAIPPQVPRGEFLGQDWTDRNFDVFLHGVMFRHSLGDFRLEAGLFNSVQNFASNYSDLLIGVTADGRAANRIVVASAGTKDESISGEARLVRTWSGDRLDHQLILSVRGRNKDRLFGGSRRISLGPSIVDEPDFRAKPSFALGPQDVDTVRQRTVGLAYNLRWRGLGTLDFGISKSHYRKEVDFASSLAINTVVRDEPILGNIAGSLNLNRKVIAFAGYTRGQEEALIAPDVAINRSESPPAIRTRQFEFGMRYALTPRLSLIAGAFKITKPYYNLDPSSRYRQLGTLSNSGLELSLAGQLAPGLRVVAGTLFLDPRISGEAVDGGLIGKRPVGQFARRSILNLDWRLLRGQSPFSFDMAIESLSGRMANTANTLEAPPSTNVNLGIRYRFDIAANKLLIRAQLQNAFGNYGWDVTPSGGFTYTNPRIMSLQMVADF